MILHIENPRDSIRKLLELVSEFSKVARYNINTQKSLAFLYTNNEKSEREMKQSIPFTTATKRIKYLGDKRTLHRKLQDTDEINQKLHKQMERYSMFLGRKNQYCENDYTNKSNLQIQCDPYQIINDIFHRTRTKSFTIHMETKKAPNSQSSLEKEEQGWRTQPS